MKPTNEPIYAYCEVEQMIGQRVYALYLGSELVSGILRRDAEDEANDYGDEVYFTIVTDDGKEKTVELAEILGTDKNFAEIVYNRRVKVLDYAED